MNCPNCGIELAEDPDFGNFWCPNCGQGYDLEDLENNIILGYN